MDIYVTIKDNIIVLNNGEFSLVQCGTHEPVFSKRNRLSFDFEEFHDKLESNDETLIKMFYVVADILNYESPFSLIQESSDKLLSIATEIINSKRPELLI